MKFPGIAEFPVHLISFICPGFFRTDEGKCTGNSALYCSSGLSGHMMCLQEMCMQLVYPGTGNLDIRPVLTGMCGQTTTTS